MPDKYREKQLNDGLVRRRPTGGSDRAPEAPLISSDLPESVVSVLSERGCLPQVFNVDLKSESVAMTVGAQYSLPGLPPGYYFKGGAAREQLRALLYNLPGKVQVRDYDLIRYMHSHDALDHELSERFMSDDYEFGRGVEVVEDKRTYFRTRDISQNEVLASAGAIEASFAAVQDMVSGILRPTRFVKDKAGDVLSATVAKIYRFAAEAQVENRKFVIQDLPANAHVSVFAGALNLDRSFAVNEAVAAEYVLLLWERSDVLSEFAVPPPLPDAVKFFARHLTQGITLFRNIPPAVLREL